MCIRDSPGGGRGDSHGRGHRRRGKWRLQLARLRGDRGDPDRGYFVGGATVYGVAAIKKNINPGVFKQLPLHTRFPNAVAEWVDRLLATTPDGRLSLLG